MPFKGYIEVTDTDPIRGWAVSEEGGPCEITMIVNGGPAVTLQSDRPRPDLERLGKSTGLGGFIADPRASLRPGVNIIELRLPDGRHIPKSPIQRVVEGEKGAGDGKLSGYIERCDGEPTGWAVTGDGRPCLLNVEVDGVRVGDLVSDLPRPDLARSGRSLGLGGFAIDLREITADGTHQVAILFGDGTHLRGSPYSIGVSVEQPADEPAVEALPSNVTRIPVTPPARPGMPSLAELDEISLDDLSLAVAGGFISVPPPPVFADPPVAEPDPSAEPVIEEPTPEPETAPTRGLIARLFRRR